MSAKSNRNGRAFEAIVFYDLVQTLKTNNSNCSITKEGYQYHCEDIKFFNELAEGDKKDLKLKKDYTDNVHLITEWLFTTFNLNNVDTILLHKFPDSAGKDGNVTDIQLNLTKGTATQQVNLSLKNNSNALKHSRIAGVPEWLGYTKTSTQYLSYTKQYKLIWDGIKEQIDTYNATSSNLATQYNELHLIAPDFKENTIYNTYYSLVESFITEHCVSPLKVQHLFYHLVGTINFYKIINKPKTIIIADYANIPKPLSLTISRDTNGYILLSFDNNWVISIRLHNGDHRLSPSLKIDAQLKDSPPFDEVYLDK